MDYTGYVQPSASAMLRLWKEGTEIGRNFRFARNNRYNRYNVKGNCNLADFAVKFLTAKTQGNAKDAKEKCRHRFTHPCGGYCTDGRVGVGFRAVFKHRSIFIEIN